MSRLVSVAVPVPFLDALTYAVPDGLEVPSIGARVLVPLGTRIVTGCVIAIDASKPDDTDIKNLIDVVDDEAFLPLSVVQLALWTANYYLAGPGEAIAAATPPGAWLESEVRITLTDRGREWRERSRLPGRSSLRSTVMEALPLNKSVALGTIAARIRAIRAAGEPPAPLPLRSVARALEREGFVTISQPIKGNRSRFKTVARAVLTLAGQGVLETIEHDRRGGASAPAEGRALTPRQQEALRALVGSPDGVLLTALRERGVGADTIKRLAARHLVEIHRTRVWRDPFDNLHEPIPGTHQPRPQAEDRSLTAEQDAALSRLLALAADAKFRVALLHGVTGSGKTEIYIRLAEAVRSAGRTILMLVPEIALTPAIAEAFRTTFGSRLAIQHSGLSDGERHDQWHRIRGREIDVVVGTRSAVFAPLNRLGLIIVDEEHDASYKQEETPRYNARDVAVMRAKRESALVVLGSATPSMESYQNAIAGRYELLRMERRVLDRPLAAVKIVNMLEEYASAGPDVIISRALFEALDDRLRRGEQALVLLNRRGLATAVFCRQCAHTLECPNCSVSLTVHTRPPGVHRGRCHYCGYSVVVPKSCRLCAGPYLEQIGFGTERLELELKAAFPGACVERLDRDSVRRRGAIGRLLGRFGRGDINILVGTQMIAKGHDFPNVTLVGVVSADVGLGLADFRAAERTFQLLTQVAGRAGRGSQSGEAIVQTLYPDHYSVRHACRQDYATFFEEEIRYRRAMRYPPLVALINAVVRGKSFGEAMERASDLADGLRVAAQRSRSFKVLGPATAPLGKLRGEHRVQLFLKGSKRAEMRQALNDTLAGRPELRRSVTVDVDPLSVL